VASTDRPNEAAAVASMHSEQTSIAFGLPAAVAEHEREAISEHTGAALAAAKARDTGLERPSAQSVSPGIAPYFSSASSLRQLSN
jgi:hypothetical protein